MSQRKNRIAEMLRVDHAGEYGAVAIYKGQQAVFGKSPKTREIAAQLAEMEAEEQKHLTAFDDLLNEHEVRPTALAPLWNVAGFGLGVVTALMGEKAAHACTEAVETVIEGHYADQIASWAIRSQSYPRPSPSSAKRSWPTGTRRLKAERRTRPAIRFCRV